ncbi:CvpA family protein [Acinetobacter qingfengensis]|uniref:Uncharacterized protein n=1 Tax=Acinetobacter qingfengensis TaxID=1262585 RepID=A0A1E7QYY8_9GAMM|nr:CvpA family protein [Acinetobacter qingfengensis]KAA8730995.1 CvpA family protein [Acinetobacter qingfengensis]OEY92226.1 hypothetical protein BJI46_05610 [Acinetobacter qingfengensis]
MNTLDLILIVLFILNSFNGFRQGLIKALANLIGWFLALILAIRWTDQVQPSMRIFTQDPVLQKIAAFIAIVMVIIILTWCVGAILQHILKHLKLSWLNRITGSAFGLGKSLIIVLILIHGASPWFSETSVWKNSRLIHLLMPYSSDSAAFSKQIVQKTAQELEHFQRNENNLPQDAIISKSSADDTKRQTENPFL